MHGGTNLSASVSKSLEIIYAQPHLRLRRYDLGWERFCVDWALPGRCMEAQICQQVCPNRSKSFTHQSTKGFGPFQNNKHDWKMGKNCRKISIQKVFICLRFNFVLRPDWPGFPEKNFRIRISGSEFQGLLLHLCWYADLSSWLDKTWRVMTCQVISIERGKRAGWQLKLSSQLDKLTSLSSGTCHRKRNLSHTKINWRRQPAIFFLRIASASEKAFARFFGHFVACLSNPLHRYEIPTEILLKMKLLRPKPATP